MTTKQACTHCRGQGRFMGMGGMTKDCLICNKTGWVDVISTSLVDSLIASAQPPINSSYENASSLPYLQQFKDFVGAIRGIIRSAYMTTNPGLNVFWDMELDGLMMRNESQMQYGVINALEAPNLNGITLRPQESLLLMFDEFMFDMLHKDKAKTHIVDNVPPDAKPSVDAQALATVQRVEAMKDIKRRGRPSGVKR